MPWPLLILGALLISNTLFLQIHGQQVAGTGIALPPKLLFEQSCQQIFAQAPAAQIAQMQGGCACTEEWRARVKCCCVGEGVRQIPIDMAGPGARAKTVSTIFLFDVALGRLTPATFAIFPNLEEIFVDSAPLLEHVDSRAFSGLKRLRKITISNCAALTTWSGTMLRDNPHIQALLVQNNPLLRDLPPLEMGAQHALPMERVDFSGNCIGHVPAGALHAVQAKTVSLAGNGRGGCMRAVHAAAFAGSKFVELDLSENPSLDWLDEDAFTGIAHIEHLDLSQTAIASLPFTGLRPLKRLTLKDVPHLKMLPPVVAFPNLVRAEFTYSHHCCFFKYATRDYYERKGIAPGQQQRELDENFRAIQRRVCRRRITAQSAAENARVRRQTQQRRHVFVHDGGGGTDTLFKELAEWYRNLELQRPLRANGTAVVPDNEPAPYSGAELGKSVVLKRCDGTAVDQFYLNLSCSPRPDALNPCEDIVSHWPLRVMIWVMWMGAIFGNLGVWAVICAAWQRKMRLHYVFMLNLSFADFLTGVYLAMLAVTDLRTANEYYNFAVEWQTGWGCAVAGFLSVFATELSTFSMLMIAAEIYYNSRYAFYGRRLGTWSATVALISGYVYSLVMAALPLMGVSSYERSSICLPLHIKSSVDRAYILLGLGLSAFAFLAMIVLYLLLNCMLRASAKSCVAPCRERAEEDRQILRRTLALIGTDMLCWVPTLFFGVTAALGHPLITLSSAKWCLVLFYPINSCANPLLYVFLTRIWRDAKQKAAPLLRRSLANAGTMSLNKLEMFYAAGPNGRRRGSAPCALERLLRRGSGGTTRHENEADADEDTEEDEGGSRPNTVHAGERDAQAEQRALLQALQQGRRASADGAELGVPKRKLSPHAQAFRDSVKLSAPTPYAHMRRKSLTVRARISSPPQMSDISESSTGSASGGERRKLSVAAEVEAVHEHEGEEVPETERGQKPLEKKAEKQQKKAKEESPKGMNNDGEQTLEAQKGEKSPKNNGQRSHVLEKRASNASATSNADGDSGRGDSLRSGTRSARPSVVSICWDRNTEKISAESPTSDTQNCGVKWADQQQKEVPEIAQIQ